MPTRNSGRSCRRSVSRTRARSSSCRSTCAGSWAAKVRSQKTKKRLNFVGQRFGEGAAPSPNFLCPAEKLRAEEDHVRNQHPADCSAQPEVLPDGIRRLHDAAVV